MHQWFLSYNGQQMGPLDTAAAQAQAVRNPNGHCWRAGFAEWLPISACAELRGAPPAGAMASPAPPAFSGGQRADVIDYKIFGEDMQFVEIELDPGESAVAEAGAMMYKDAVVNMETVFGDGKGSGGGFMDKLLGAGKRLVTGESLFTTVFTHGGGSGKARGCEQATFQHGKSPKDLAGTICDSLADSTGHLRLTGIVHECGPCAIARTQTGRPCEWCGGQSCRQRAKIAVGSRRPPSPSSRTARSPCSMVPGRSASASASRPAMASEDMRTA